ncbi:MAG: phosphatidate cytidylyltransferase, partial [Oligoflexia bacterium]|nr:phosphatidate cytidylyltransferase [Oligoflexia bacterium]
MLKKRIFSAIVAIAIGTPIIVFLGPYALYIFTFLVAAACLYEYLAMIMLGDSAREIRIVGTSLGVTLLALNAFFKGGFNTISTIMLISYCLYFLFRAGKYKAYITPSEGELLGRNFMDLSLSLFGILFFITLLGYLPLLRDMPNGLKWVILLMAVVWLGDTGAY